MKRERIIIITDKNNENNTYNDSNNKSNNIDNNDNNNYLNNNNISLPFGSIYIIPTRDTVAGEATVKSSTYGI
jgi:hypothetical protein